MSTITTVVAGATNFGAPLAKGISNVARWIYQGMTGSLINTTGYWLNGGKQASDVFVKSHLGGYIAGGLIKIPVAVIAASSALDDLRRIRETAGGQSGFYVSREAEDRTAMLSGAAALLSATSLFRLGNLGKSIDPGKPSLMAAFTGISAAALLVARSVYKWVNIDLPFNATSGLAAISFGKPIMRVDNPESPYYMMSHSLEKSVNARIHEDQEHGKAGEGVGKFLEAKMLGISDFFMGSRHDAHVSPSGDSYSSSQTNSVSHH